MRRSPPAPLLAALALLALLPALLMAGTGVLLANGGTLRVSDAPAGPYRVTVYTDPTPPRPDSVDVSVLIVLPGRYETVDGLDVEVLAWPDPTDAPPDSTPPTIRTPATRDQADDPRYYAAKFAPGTPGPWRFEVRVQGPDGGGTVPFTLALRHPGPLDNPWIILLLALLPLAAVGWWLLREDGT